MDQKQFCMNCGNQVDAGVSACPACGTPMPAAPVNNAAAPASQPMKQFCASCGNTIEGNVSNCPNCGAIVTNAPITGGNAGALSGNNKNLLIPLIAVVVALILIIVGCVLIFGGGSKEEPIENIVAVMEDGDGDALVALLPESFVEAVIEEEYDDDEDEFYDECDEQAESIHEDLVDEYGDDISVSYEITDEDELKKSELKMYEATISYLVDDVEIEEGYELEVEFEIEGDDDEDTDEMTITVMKVDGDWVTLDFFN